MGAKSLAAFLILFSLLTLIGCGNNDEAVNSPTSESMTGGQSAGAENGSAPAAFGGNAQWPEYIPNDIPQLEGNIRTIMMGSSHIRIFYEAVTEKQIKQYLDELERMGFQLEYIVYTQEGFPDNSEEKLKRGEFDAVDITKGDYHMRLEAGGGTAVYDIDIIGFTVPAPTAPPTYSPPTAVPLQWPDTPVPPPDSCELTSILNIGDSQYMINCQFTAEGADVDYIETLQAAGFVERDRFEDMNGGLISLTLEKGDTAVTLLNSLGDSLSIQIKPANP